MAKALICLLLSALCGLASAQLVRDPTQPAPGFGPAGELADMAPAAVVQGRVLQSVIRRHGAKPVAMISGNLVPLGGKIDEFVLVKLTENEAKLRGPAGEEILVMTTTDGKTPVGQAGQGKK